MPSSPISFLITTASLYLLVISLVGSFSVMSKAIMRDSVKSQLAEVADHVARSMTELRALLQLSGENGSVLIKTLDLPIELASFGYTVKIEETDGMLFVVAVLDSDRSMSASCALWLESDEVSVMTEAGSFTTEDLEVTYDSQLHSGQKSTLVWARNIGEGLWVGLGASPG